MNDPNVFSLEIPFFSELADAKRMELFELYVNAIPELHDAP